MMAAPLMAKDWPLGNDGLWPGLPASTIHITIARRTRRANNNTIEHIFHVPILIVKTRKRMTPGHPMRFELRCRSCIRLRDLPQFTLRSRIKSGRSHKISNKKQPACFIFGGLATEGSRCD